MKKASIDDLWNPDQTAKKIGISASWLSRRRQLGLPPRYLKIGHRVFYRPKDLQNLIGHSLVKPKENVA